MTGDKGAMRERIRRKRPRLDAGRRDAQSRVACGRVTGLEEFKTATVVGCYLATVVEVDTEAIVGTALAQGKRVCVPAYRESTQDYGLCWFDGDTPMTPGPWGIREPRQPRWIDRHVDMLVAPAMAFDSAGGRLGHGGGFYDRLMAGEWLKGTRRIGLGFSWQMMERVPTVAHDLRMDVVVTEESVVRIGGE